MNAMHVDETIAAIASAPGGGLRGIIRISGPATARCLRPIFCTDVNADWDRGKVARVISGRLLVGEPFGEIPCDLFFWPTARSYTRQPSAELHLIGSPPLLAAALQAVAAAGARPALPGEFTLRAFLAGRLDLTQAEAVLGVIDAQSQRELDVALEQLAGGLARPLARLRNDLLDLLAQLEAGLDFVEEDIEFIEAGELQRQLAAAATVLDGLLSQLQTRAASGNEPRVVLVGWPNVGKSSLLNALAGESAAIVSEIAGTTRDYLIRRVRCNNVDCLLIDTAGVLAGAAPLDLATGRVADQAADLSAAAQAMTADQCRHAHLQLFCLDASRPLNPWEIREIAAPAVIDRMFVLTKTDADPATDFHGDAIATSSRTGRGLADLKAAIARRLATLSSADSGLVAGTALRCRDSIRQAAASLNRALSTSFAQQGDELIAAELRLALDELGQVTGAIYTDDILDRIFQRFCIGK